MVRRTCLACFVLAIVISASDCLGQTYVRPYVRSNGTYVGGYYRSAPDGNFWNNYSTYPNVNPYTGQTGTRLYPSYAPSYRSYTPYYPTYRSRYGW
jgi:hypothetical protein